jgi:hypothetical protein
VLTPGVEVFFKKSKFASDRSFESGECCDYVACESWNSRKLIKIIFRQKKNINNLTNFSFL